MGSKDYNSSDRRLVRMETRLTNLGRYMGFDLTQPPAPNQPDQPVFINDGAVFCTATAQLGEMTMAVMRYQQWTPADTEVPVVINGKTVATVDAWGYVHGDQSNGQDNGEKRG